jgi:hypothetical protein
MDVKEELIEQQTILIALDDKLHRFQKIMSRLRERVSALEEAVSKGDIE